MWFLLSSARATLWPPPMQRTTMPRFNPSRFMACSRRVVSLRDSIKTDADGIHCDSRVGHCHFRLFVQSYGASCVKSDGIPDKLDLLFRDTAILRSVAIGQSQIVRNNGDGQKV